MIRYDHYIDGAARCAVFRASSSRPRTRTPARSGPRSRAATAPTPRPRSPPRSARSPTGAWPALTPSERGRMLWRLGDLVVANAPRLAEIEQRDNGKLAAEVVAQVRYMGDYFRYYAGLADKVQSAVIPTDKKGVFAYTRYEPKGVVAIITPWNSPLTLTSWKLAPALAAGCTAVIKPSEFTSASMLELAQLFDRGGLSERRRQRRHRPRARSRRGAGHASGGRAHRLHRRRGGGPQDLRARRAQLQDRDARARRQVAQHRLRRRRPRPGGQGRRLGHLRGDRARAARPDRGCWSSARSTTPSSRKLVDFMQGREARRPDRAGHADRPGRDAAAVREGPLLHRDRQGRGRDAARSAAGAGPTSAPACSSSRRSSPASTTACGSRRRRSSARCSSVIPFEDEADAIAIGNDVAYGLAAGGVDAATCAARCR